MKNGFGLVLLFAIAVGSWVNVLWTNQQTDEIILALTSQTTEEEVGACILHEDNAEQCLLDARDTIDRALQKLREHASAPNSDHSQEPLKSSVPQGEQGQIAADLIVRSGTPDTEDTRTGPETIPLDEAQREMPPTTLPTFLANILASYPQFADALKQGGNLSLGPTLVEGTKIVSIRIREGVLPHGSGIDHYYEKKLQGEHLNWYTLGLGGMSSLSAYRLFWGATNEKAYLPVLHADMDWKKTAYTDWVVPLATISCPTQIAELETYIAQDAVQH